ncbi:SWIM zinc finger family protein [Actinopolymorpha alba]|uniref:SWIM zinc finger family protein n=1 Tax=Actinopolymorpha alba TaxID=533267 RepID=UPI00035DB380|nr:SWIM zinc finger family protein [Actinopolymorpha alba]
MSDDDRVRGFPAFVPQRGRRRSTRGQSWWARAWVSAMEETSLDGEQLRRGRRYASLGHVGTITVSPGRIAAPVHDGNQHLPYDTVVYVTELTDAEWERFLDEVARKAGHLAALLDKDMPHDLVHAAADAGVRLLPSVGDLEPECSCPDWELPCKHAAALSYQGSWLLDEDPFVLLLMRGRGEREFLDELARRNASAPGIDPEGLAWLVKDAAARAGALLAAADPGELTYPRDRWRDGVRLAATHQDPRLSARLEEASGRPSSEWARAIRAWEQAGQAGLEALEHVERE